MGWGRSRLLAGGLALLFALGAFGCARKHYDYTLFTWAHRPGDPTDVSIQYGSPGPVMRRAATVVDSPRRLLPERLRRTRHALSEETTAQLVSYLERNDLADVPVFINHYDPGDQWRRLRENKRISPVYRYTAGSWSVLKYTLLPNPVFGGNKYNPYTNSLYLETDRPIDVLYAAADAKNLHTRKLPGTYLLVTSIPGPSLARGVWATGDVVGYAAAQGDWETEREVYRVLYPRVGAESFALAAPPGSRWWISPLLRLGGSATGRGVGGLVERRRRTELGVDDDQPPDEEETTREPPHPALVLVP